MNKQEMRKRALERAAKALKNARLRKSDSGTDALRKLDAAMSKEFGENYQTDLRPAGILLAEKIKLPKKIPKVTGSGTLKCRTLVPPEGCSPDADF